MSITENKRDTAFFGPGGNGDWFYAERNKSTLQAPAWVKSKDLDAYEFEAGRGVGTGEETLKQIGAAAAAAGVRMSLHAPYFISLSGVDPETRLKSVGYITQSLRAAELLGAETIVIHSGSAGKIDRREAMRLSCDTLEAVLQEIGDAYAGIQMGIETMGKLNQLGTLEEVIEQCKVSKRYAPVVDFGHLNARENGCFPDADSYRRVFDRIATELGDDYAKYMHCHFSKIEYTGAGEKKHLTFEDTVYGPAFEPLMEAVARENLCPTFICESAGTQAEDALTMKKYYQSVR